MLTRDQILDEAQRQKNALATMGRWRNWLFILTTLLLVLAVSLLRGGGAGFVWGILAAVLTGISFLLLLLVNLSIRNGHRNVERMLDSLQS